MCIYISMLSAIERLCDIFIEQNMMINNAIKYGKNTQELIVSNNKDAIKAIKKSKKSFVNQPEAKPVTTEKSSKEIEQDNEYDKLM